MNRLQAVNSALPAGFTKRLQSKPLDRICEDLPKVTEAENKT